MWRDSAKQTEKFHSYILSFTALWTFQQTTHRLLFVSPALFPTEPKKSTFQFIYLPSVYLIFLFIYFFCSHFVFRVSAFIFLVFFSMLCCPQFSHSVLHNSRLHYAFFFITKAHCYRVSTMRKNATNTENMFHNIFHLDAEMARQRQHQHISQHIYSFALVQSLETYEIEIENSMFAVATVLLLLLLLLGLCCHSCARFKNLFHSHNSLALSIRIQI